MFMYSDYSQHLLDHVKKIHFIGCGGSGMYPLIQILAAKGYELSGSDVLDGSIIRYEREMGVKVSLGHNADNVVGADMVVASQAADRAYIERGRQGQTTNSGEPYRTRNWPPALPAVPAFSICRSCSERR